ncbi:MAG: DUF4384 domain-containing protein [Myxococcales bacterium]|nr:DUF4384 domain-containing protein [Myxococcales bacterium]
MRSPRSLLVLLALVGCGPAGALTDPTKEPPPSAARSINDTNLLLVPVADGESLLGREVQKTDDGAYSIAATRKPGCSVRVKETKAVYKVAKKVDLSDVTAVGGGFKALVTASARYGSADKVDIAVENHKLLEVERVEGDCGDIIVNKVFIGSGKRSFERRRDLAGRVDGNFGGVTPSASHASSGALEDTLEWDGDQAYGYTFADAGKNPALRLKMEMPSIIQDGEELAINFETNRKAWLVVFYVDAKGEGAVLWPSAEEPEPVVEEGKKKRLPSPSEKEAGIALVGKVAEPGKAARETLVAYAFENKADFDRVKPVAGATDVDGPGLATDLTLKVGDVPSSRWTRAMSHYVIAPNQ